jgi:TRAP-type transport system periplasmic protein
LKENDNGGDRMYRNKFIILLVTIFVLLLSACGGTKSGTEDSSKTQEKTEIVMGTGHPTTHHAHLNVYTPWNKLVEEKTDGKITVSHFPNATLGKSETVVEDIGSGVYDVGLMVIPYLFDSPFYPYTIASLPFAFPDVKTAHNAVQKLQKKYPLEEAFEEANIMSLGGQTATDPYIIFSKKPIKSYDDLKGMKIHVPGDSVVDVVKAWGATPVSMAQQEVYQSLERGALDASIYTPVGAVGFKIHEIAPYVVDIGITSTPISMIINKEIYDGFSDETKETFESELNAFMPTAFRDSYVNEVTKAFEVMKASGAEVIKLPAEEEAKFIKPAQKVWKAWVEEANEKGFDGDQIMKDFIEILKEEGVEVPFDV